MKKQGTPRFDVSTLRELAGPKVFARGQEYHDDGQVELLAIDRARVLARVAGTEDYRTVLTGGGVEIDGECSCPAFDDWGFCKHMVAAALATNAAGSDAEAESTGALQRIRDHLEARGIDALVEMIMEIAEHDTALFRKLDLAAAAVSADDKVLEARLRKAIDGATGTRHYIDYREAAGWAAEVDEALDAVAGIVSAGRGMLALRLAERAIDRVERCVESIDDSDGHCGTLLARSVEIHLAAAREAQPDPVQLARDLFAREMNDDFNAFAGAMERYADVLGEAGLAEYRCLATEAWEKLPPCTGGGRGHDEYAGEYEPLIGMLDFFAERDGDVDARIVLRAKDLSSPWKYLQLAEFCLNQGCEKEALRRAEDGLWLFEDERPDERLLFFTAELLLKAGRPADAEKWLWSAFKKQPSLGLYEQLRKVGGATARDRALEFLQARLSKETGSRWYPADLLIDILMQEEMYGRAWTTARQHSASLAVKQALARATEAIHPREALETYAECVEQLVAGGGNPAYEKAAALVARMSGLRSAAEQNVYVLELKARFGRKRNFMKLLG